MQQLKGKTMPQWNKDETKSILASVNNILSGGDGGMKQYDPNKISKVSTSLSMVDDYANGTDSSDMELKYGNLPENLREGLHQSAYRVNEGGSMSSLELMKEAKSNRIKLSDKELDKLERNPGVQRKYLNIKTSSKSVPTEKMELEVESIVEDFDKGTIKNKNQLTTRLTEILRDVSASDLDFTVSNIWGTLTKNLPSSKRKQEILENNKELNGFADRTWEEKNKEIAFSLGDEVVNGLLNVFEWATKQAVKLGSKITPKSDLGAKASGYENADDLAKQYIMNVNTNNLSPETRADVENARDYIIGKEVVDYWATYKKVSEEKAIADVEEMFNEKKDAYTKSLPGDQKKNLQQKEGSAYSDFGGFIGNLMDAYTVTRAFSSVFTTLVGDVFLGSNGTTELLGKGGTQAVEQFLKTPQKDKILRTLQNAIEWGNLGAEGVGFSIQQEGEVDPRKTLTYMGVGKIVNWASNSATNLLQKTELKSILGTKGFDTVVNNLTKKGYTVKGAIDAMTDLFGKFKIVGDNPEMQVVLKDVIGTIDNGLEQSLAKVEQEFSLKMVKEMAEYLMGKGIKGIDSNWSAEATESLLRNEYSKTLGDDVINNLFKTIKKVSDQKGDKVNLLDAFNVRKVFGKVVDAWKKSGETKSTEFSQRANDLYMTSEKQISDLFAEYGGEFNKYLHKKGFTNLEDIMNVKEVLGLIKDSVGGKGKEGFWDRFLGMSGKFLGGGVASEVAQQAGAEGAIANPYMDTGILSFIFSKITSPEKASYILNKISRWSLVDTFSLVNGVLSKSTKKEARDYIRTFFQEKANIVGTEAVEEIGKLFDTSDKSNRNLSDRYDVDDEEEIVDDYYEKRREELTNKAGGGTKREGIKKNN